MGNRLTPKVCLTRVRKASGKGKTGDFRKSPIKPRNAGADYKERTALAIAHADALAGGPPLEQQPAVANEAEPVVAAGVRVGRHRVLVSEERRRFPSLTRQVHRRF